MTNEKLFRGARAAALLSSLVVAASCGAGLDGNADGVQANEQSLIGAVSGSVPNGMPARLTIGLFGESASKTWMQNSGVPWDSKYRYFTKGWVNNYGYTAADGSFATSFFNECATQGYMPAVAYYQLNNEAGGGESAFYAKTQNATTMRSYFGDFKILMERARDFGKPVLVMVEADGFGLMEQQTGNNPNAYSAIAATGMPELAGLPNTAAGWGLAFIQLRKAVGANNVILGMHISHWATGKDISAFSVTDPLEPEVTKGYAFHKPLGLGANVTGQTYEVIVADPLDRDADYFRITRGENRWWDASDAASINSRSFNRYAEWMRQWNVASGKRWVVWQIPLGNSNHLNVDNAGGARQGYKDNRAEYFFGDNSRAHLEKWASAGAIALLFGYGPSQASFENDTYTDGQLFMKSRAGAFLKAGGLPIPAGPTTGTTDPGTTTPTEPAPGTTTPTEPAPGTTTPAPTPTAPAFTTSATVSPASVAAGATSTITAKVTNTGASLTGGIVDIEVYDAAGSRVGLKYDSNVSLAAGQTGTFTYAWPAAATGGAYSVKIGVFGPNWSPNYHWNNGAATITVTATTSGTVTPPTTTTGSYDFETGLQGWAASGSLIKALTTTTALANTGTRSLAIDFGGRKRGNSQVAVASPGVPAGRAVTMRVWIPASSRLTSVQPFVQQDASGGSQVTSNSYAISSLTPGAWNTVTVTVPANAAPLAKLGVQFTTNGGWTGSAYLDSVTW